ncbi:hypothetical protein JYK00_01280 [Thermosipho ferrireducens]|uniref:Uncharacterized protein n=1 Tax=Thermosipho ferrireducens TaxID=2571116 RepID=A0ABX7S6I9_9BACT|nr:hypothetical protein [Thermosipho ferrireducens]QTA38202.1 hypothetical protein JYK00_01280 [Thermosipho ferrireducens]
MCESTDFTELKSCYVVDLPEYNVYLPVQLGEHKIIKLREKFVCDPFTKLKQKVKILSFQITDEGERNIFKTFYVSSMNTEVGVKIKFNIKLVPETFRSFVMVLKGKDDDEVLIRVFGLIEKSGEMVFYLKFDGERIRGEKYLELYSCGEKVWSESIEIIKNTYGGVRVW